MLTYVAGSGILESALVVGGALSPVVQNATLAQVLTVNQGVWYALPAFVLPRREFHCIDFGAAPAETRENVANVTIGLSRQV